MTSYGLIIYPEGGGPGLYKDVPDAKSQVWDELVDCYGVEWSTRVEIRWHCRIDANYESASLYSTAEDGSYGDWIADLDYEVWYIVAPDLT